MVDGTEDGDRAVNAVREVARPAISHSRPTHVSPPAGNDIGLSLEPPYAALGIDEQSEALAHQRFDTIAREAGQLGGSHLSSSTHSDGFTMPSDSDMGIPNMILQTPPASNRPQSSSRDSFQSTAHRTTSTSASQERAQAPMCFVDPDVPDYFGGDFAQWENTWQSLVTQSNFASEEELRNWKIC